MAEDKPTDYQKQSKRQNAKYNSRHKNADIDMMCTDALTSNIDTLEVEARPTFAKLHTLTCETMASSQSAWQHQK